MTIKRTEIVDWAAEVVVAKKEDDAELMLSVSLLCAGWVCPAEGGRGGQVELDVRGHLAPNSSTFTTPLASG